MLRILQSGIVAAFAGMRVSSSPPRTTMNRVHPRSGERGYGKIIALTFLGFLICVPSQSHQADACCHVYRSGQPVVNSDQTVIILWDAATKTQHFIRQASFKGDADDFGFLVPSPSQPELSEAGDDAFPYLRKLTEPEVKTAPARFGVGCGCSAAMPDRGLDATGLAVKVLEEKLVAGFNAAVLETRSSTALVKWLQDNGYAFSPEVGRGRNRMDAG